MDLDQKNMITMYANCAEGGVLMKVFGNFCVNTGVKLYVFLVCTLSIIHATTITITTHSISFSS